VYGYQHGGCSFLRRCCAANRKIGKKQTALRKPTPVLFKAEPATFPEICCRAGAARKGLLEPGCPTVRSYQLMYHHLMISSNLFHALVTVLYVLTTQEQDAI